LSRCVNTSVEDLTRTHVSDGRLPTLFPMSTSTRGGLPCPPCRDGGRRSQPSVGRRRRARRGGVRERRVAWTAARSAPDPGTGLAGGERLGACAAGGVDGGWRGVAILAVLHVTSSCHLVTSTRVRTSTPSRASDRRRWARALGDIAMLPVMFVERGSRRDVTA